MNRLSIYICFTLLLLPFFASSLHAQDSHPPFGIGIGIEPTRLFQQGSTIYSYIVTPVNIYFTVNLSEKFRLEPEFGVFSFSEEQISFGSSSKRDFSNIHIGVGGLYLMPVNADMILYTGPRLGLYFLSEGSASSSITQTNITVGGILGGEYFASRNLSFGGEAQLNYATFGKPSSFTGSELSRHAIHTNALFFLRWYFKNE